MRGGEFPTVAQGDRLIRRREVSYLTGLARSTIYKKMKAGEFPQAIHLGVRYTVWSLLAVQGWIEQQLGGKPS